MLSIPPPEHAVLVAPFSTSAVRVIKATAPGESICVQAVDRFLTRAQPESQVEKSVASVHMFAESRCLVRLAAVGAGDVFAVANCIYSSQHCRAHRRRPLARRRANPVNTIELQEQGRGIIGMRVPPLDYRRQTTLLGVGSTGQGFREV